VRDHFEGERRTTAVTAAYHAGRTGAVQASALVTAHGFVRELAFLAGLIPKYGA
jgi:hypothetical protein